MKIFISHASSDENLVRQLEQHFRAAKFTVWIDHSEIRAGDRLPQKINEALKWCDTFCLIWSEAASKSRWVALEWESALTLGKRIVPCLLDKTELPELLLSTVYHKIDSTEKSLVQLTRILRDNSPQHLREQPRDKNYKFISSPQYLSFSGTLEIQGGAPLRGTVVVRGAKNTLPKHLAASLLTEDECVLTNIADVRDVRIISDMIRALGGSVITNGDELRVSTSEISSSRLSELHQFAGLSRVPILFCGPLLHRFGFAVIPALGGCKLNGHQGRKTDMHEKVLRLMGASLHTNDDGSFEAESHNLKSATINFKQKSVGATEQALLTAAKLEGTTHIINAAIDPEVIDLIDLLRSMGAQIRWHKSHRIEIHGRTDLKGFRHRAMTDRSEIASWACAAAATNGEIKVVNARADDLTGFNNKFRQIGGEIIEDENALIFRRKGAELRATDIRTGPHPEFRTDWQPPFVALLTQAKGESLIHETVFSDRLGYTIILNSLGADIEVLDRCIGGDCGFVRSNAKHSAIIKGPSKLHGGNSRFVDLRGAFATLIAALIAEDNTVLHDCAWLEKGYENIEDKLVGVGASIKRVHQDSH